MTSTRSADATALSASLPRRGFLAGLASVPLVGSGVAPADVQTTTVTPETLDLLEAYKTWLDFEKRFLCWQMAEAPHFVDLFAQRGAPSTPVSRYDEISRSLKFVGRSGSYHCGRMDAPPSTRAALVLTAVGCDWRERA